MLTLISSVDKTVGSYEDVFIYTLNAGFSGIEKEINTAKVVLEIPKGMEIYLGDIEEPIKEAIKEETDTETTVTFDFGAIEDTGIAVRIGLGVTFTTEIENGSNFELISKMYINDEEMISYANEAIELSVIPRFELERTMVLPAINPAPGGEIYFKTTLENFGDLGGIIKNIKIVIEEAEGLTLDQTYSVVGKDVSNGSFIDTSQDGVIGIYNGNTIEFNLESYRGEVYEFYYKAIISSELDTGTKIVTNANWSVDDVERTVSVNTITLAVASALGSISAYGADYTIQNANFGYEFSIGNVGNQALETVTIVEDLPEEINYYRIRTGTYGYTGIDDELIADYTIYYETDAENTGEFGPFSTNIDSEIDLEAILASGENIASLTWEIEMLSVGIVSKIPVRIDGIIRQDIDDNTTIVNRMTFSHIANGTKVETEASKSTLVQDTSVLTPTFSQTYTGTPINPGTTIRYTIGASARNSRLNNPIIAFVMPKQLEYMGNATIKYDDYFEGDLYPELPEAILVENINDNGDTAVKFEFKDDNAFDFRQKSTFSISFDANVQIGAKDTFQTFCILNTFLTNEIILDEQSWYKDTADIADDSTVSSVYARSTINSNSILFFVSTKSKKYVKGSLDEDYVEEPEEGTTTEGGLVNYKISITNIGNADLEQIEVVDILPYIGDTGVIDITEERDSQFFVSALNEVTAKVLKEDGEEEVAEFKIYYSTSTDPVRFGGSFTTIGTDDNWSEIAPEDLTEIRSIKVSTIDTLITPNEVLEVEIQCVVPVGVEEEAVAWNSFAANVAYTNSYGETEDMLAIEPQKVGIQIANQVENTGEISGYTWFDTNKDGLPDEEKTGINGVGIILIDEDGIIVDYTFSAPNSNQEDGYYLLTGIEYGNYTMVFVKDDEYSFTTQVLDDGTGSKVDASGDVEEFTIDEESSILVVNAGLINKAPTSIEMLLEVNKSANAVVKNVIRSQMLLGMKMEDTISLINLLDK